MSKTQHFLLISQPSTPTTTSAPVPTSTPSSATIGFPTQSATPQVTSATGFDWISFIAGLGIGAIFAAWIKRRGDWLLKQKDEQLAKERQQHEKEMRLLEADYQFLQRWREFLSQESNDLGQVWGRYKSSLECRLSPEAIKRVERTIGSQTRILLNEIQ